MKIYKIPENLKTIIFDIDGTLYTSPEYVKEQVDVQIRHWSKLNGWSAEEGRNKISVFQKKWEAEHEGKKISLGNTFTHFGVDINTSIQWRNSILEPEKFLSKNEDLIKALEYLKTKYTMICVTNNPVEAARKTLMAIGIHNLIPQIVGLDTCLESKPSRNNLLEALRLTESKAENALSIGDRYHIDLELPLEMGMGAVLVDGAQDICTLSKSL